MRVDNRQFNRSYEEIETLEAGIVLNGGEVKSVKAGNIRLEKAYVKIVDGEAYLMNAEVAAYQFTRAQDHEVNRKRKLLLHKKELLRLNTKLKSAGNLTIIPLACYNKGRHIKLQIALARGRSDLKKKKLVKARDIKINQKREMKEYLKK
ncbi:MAG: SsrA-binding protein SmpB [Weeksellaceae bacterium]